MNDSPEPLPIDEVLPEILTALRGASRLVIAAPPGAGKTTKVPLALLDEDWTAGRKLLLLEPRRIAARMAAERMAATLGEKVGATVGLSTRIDRKVSKATRIEVITDGLFTRRLLNDPELGDVAGVLFDEFHERSLNADLGLALARDVQEGLRDDLRLIVMSATLDTEKVAGAFGAPVIESEGRMFPVETIYLGRDDRPVPQQMTAAIRRALKEQEGSILCFLPGQAEIRRTVEALGAPGDGVMVAPLYGGLSPKDQDLAVAPPPKGNRKVVIATDIAESSLTIEGVTVVIDAGLARVPEYDPSTGSQTLRTRRASVANIDQRRGRAGRTAPGTCYRLWDEPATRGLVASPTPEILIGDISGLMLSLAEWGVSDPTALPFLDPPPEGRVRAARQELEDVGALTDDGRLTEEGRRMASLPLPPALAAMVVRQDTPEDRALAAHIAVLLSEQGLGGRSTDLRARLAGFRRDQSPRANALRQQAARWSDKADPAPTDRAGALIAAALPARIARRQGEVGRFLMASGRAAWLDETDPLASEDWLAIGALTGSAARARITAAAPLSEEEALRLGRPETVDTATFQQESGSLKAERIKRIGAITLSRTPLPAPKGDAATAALTEAVRTQGLDLLPAYPVIAETLARAALAGADDKLNEDILRERLEEWLPPLLGTPPRLDRPQDGALRSALLALIPDWDLVQRIERDAPLSFTSPAGRKLPIDYLAEGGPRIEARVQEFYGLTEHPALARGHVPLTVSLTSPAGRPVAVTKDLSGFWAGGYRDMAKDMRGRYPKHDWPDDPSTARPHEGRTKARLGK